MDKKHSYILVKQKRIVEEQGFTLIELLVVIVIIGVLTAVALPSLLGQIGKSKEAEAKNNLGAMARAQQLYHYEKQVFADNLAKLAANATFVSQYYNFPEPDVASSSLLQQKATSTDYINNGTRDYAIGIYYSAGAYDFTLCQAANIGATVEAPGSIADTCTNGGFKIR